MAKIGEFVIRILGDSKSLDRSMQSSTEKLKKFQGQARRVGLASVGMGLAIAGTAFVAVKAAQKQEQGIARLNNALKNSGASYAALEGQIEKLAAKQQELTNFGDDQTRDMLTRMITLSGDAAASIEHLALAQDLATHMTRDGGDASRKQKMAAEAMGRAIAGDVAALRMFLPALKGTARELDSTATMMDVLTALQAQFGGLAKEDADSFKQLSNAIGDVKEALGSALLPAVLAVTNALTDITLAVSKWVDDNSKLAWGIFIAVGALAAAIVLFGGAAIAISAVTATVLTLTGAVSALSAVMFANPIGLVILAILALVGVIILAVKYWDKLIDVVKNAWGWFTNLSETSKKIAITLAVIFAPLVILVAGIAALIAGIVLLVKNWDKVVDAVKKAWGWFMKLSPAIRLIALVLALPLLPIIGLIAGIVRLAKNWDEVWGAISRGFSFYTEGIKSSFELGFGWLLPGGLLHKALSWLRGTLTSFWRRVSSVWDVVAGFLGVGLESDVEKYKEETESKWAVLHPVFEVGIGLVTGDVERLWKGLKGSWKLIDQTVQPLVVVVHWVADIAKGLWKALGIAWGALASTVLSIGAAFSTTALTLWTLLKAGWDNLASKTLHPVLALVSGAAKALWDKLTEWWNALFSSGSSRRRAASTKNVLRIPAAAFSARVRMSSPKLCAS